MSSKSKAEGVKRISLWFPDAMRPCFRTLPGDQPVELTTVQEDGNWAVMVRQGDSPRESVAVYQTEKEAIKAISRSAATIDGKVVKDSWWYARWGAVLSLLTLILILEIYLATTPPEDLIAQDAAALSLPGGGTATANAGGLPQTSFGGGGSYGNIPAAPAAGFAGTQGAAGFGGAAGNFGVAPGTAGGFGAPQGRAGNATPGGLSAFGLDERTPPGGLSGGQSSIFDAPAAGGNRAGGAINLDNSGQTSQ